MLVKILTYHVVPGNVESSQLKAGEVKTVQGDAINVKISSDKKAVTVNDAEVVTPDVKGYNGVIHIINKVIIPPSL
ncbi:COG2335: Secreted and surface protein containing fasciclin-like repeats [Richelia intracellularis]|nr:COG2335: Secreted and surface protein containing fasciclin-like repeats [Richelia intracellularis]